jgi:trigger factor
MEQVAENLTVEIPDAMIETQAKQFIDNFKMQLAQQGIPYDEYLKMTGTEEASLLEEAKEPAMRQVRMDLAMGAIIKAENITASDEEVEAEYQHMAEQYSMDIEMVKKYLNDEQVRDELISRKAIEVVTSSAKAKKARKTTKKTTKKAEKEAEKETEKDAE